MKITSTRTSVAIACALMASGCATGPNGQPQSFGNNLKSTFASDDPCSNNARNIGILAGGVLGAVIGKSIGDGKAGSMVAGAAVGALVGGFIGSDMDRRRCELSKVAKAHNLDILMTDITFSAPAQAPSGDATQTAQYNGGNTSSVPNASTKPEAVGMSLTVFDHGNQFALGAAIPSKEAAKAFADVADKYAAAPTGNDPNAVHVAKERNKKMRILLIGHTDDTGSSQLNADLSEERARAIAKIFAQRGFDASQIYYQGAGEVYPIADNRTEEGRARNRRVEIVDLSDDAAFNAFLASRRPNVAHYRPASLPGADTQLASSTAKKNDGRKASGATFKTANKEVGSDVRPEKTASTTSVKSPQPSAEKNIVAVAAPSTDQAASFGTADGKANSSAKNAPSQAKSEATVNAAPWGNLDFGGKLVHGDYKTVNIGKPVHSGGFSIVSNAYASDSAPLGSCATDRARISNRVKSLDSGQALKTAAYLPGTASSSWAGRVNGHLVGLTGVAVLRDGGQPAGRPTLFIWKDWVDGSKAKPVLKTTGDVNAYQGDKALLYRVFPNEGPVRCVDMVIPTSAPSTAPESTLVYEHAKAMYQADYSPTIAR